MPTQTFEHQFEFVIPDITCEACAGRINNALKHLQQSSVQESQVEIAKKILKIKVQSQHLQAAILKEEICETLLDYGFSSKEIAPATALANSATPIESFQSRFKRFLTSHWFLGSLGVSSGILLMLVMTCCMNLALPLMLGIGVLSSALTIALGYSFYSDAIRSLIKSRTLTMDSLFAISTITSIIVSCVSIVLPGLPMMFEVGLLVFGFRHLGIAIKENLTKKIDPVRLQNRLPTMVQVISPHGIENKPLSAIAVGDLIVIPPGTIIPADGIACNSSTINNTFTGADSLETIDPDTAVSSGMYVVNDQENSPLILKVTPIMLKLKEGEIVPLDCICQEDCKIFDAKGNRKQYKYGDHIAANSRFATPTKVQIIPVGRYSYLHRLDYHNQAAQFSKAKIEESTQKKLQYFILGILAIAILSGIVLASLCSLSLAIQCMCSVLVAACPCTLGLITPLAMRIGFNKAASFGAQFKRGESFAAGAKVDTVVFDLNGTLTTGIATVTQCHIFQPNLISQKTFFSYFAAAERKAKHHVAVAILNYLKDKTLDPMTVDQVNTSTHSGVKVQIGSDFIIVGNENIMKEQGIDLTTIPKLNLTYKDTAIYLARSNQILGCLVVSTPLRPYAKKAIAALKDMGKEVFICTGGDQATAQRYANYLGILTKNIRSNCVPIADSKHSNSKVAFIQQLQAENKHVAMVGDGINDAAAIAGTFGIAIKSSSSDEVTQQEAEVIVQDRSLLAIPNALAIAKQTVNNIKQNLAVSLGYNATTLLLSAGLLIALGLTLNPVICVAAMIIQSSLLLLNAYRFKNQPLQHLVNNKPSIKLSTNSSAGMLQRMQTSTLLHMTITKKTTTKKIKEKKPMSTSIMEQEIISRNYIAQQQPLMLN